MSNRYFFHLLLVLLCLLGQDALFAQTQVVLRAGDVTTAGGTNTCVPVIADSFPDIVGMQWSLRWDPAIATYTHVDFGTNPVGIGANDAFSPNDSTFNISWLSPNNMGVTLAFGTVIASVCFDPVAASGTTPMSFTGGVPPEFIQDGDFNVFPFTVTDGSYTIVSQQLLSMLPGDTNQDSLVNADDLLNIGLGFGLNGPARSNPQTDFNFQSAPVWETSTPQTNVNYAHVDADGNGSIDAADQNVLAANYGQNMLGLLPDYAAAESSNLLIRVEAQELIGGQLSVINLYVDKLNGDAVPAGYGLAFGLQLSPDQFDFNTISVDFSGSYLGNDLLTFAERYPFENNLLEIAATRKDQQNGPADGGLICSITLRPNIFPTDINTAILAVPYRFIDKDETNIPMVAGTFEVTIQAPVSVKEPVWARGLGVSPNPVSGNLLTLNGLPAQVSTIGLMNLQGRTLATYPANDTSLQLPDLSAGVYYLRFYAGNETASRKIVVVN